MIISDVVNILEEFAPVALQEDFDNSGLTIGNRNQFLTGILITFDVTEEVVAEAIKTGSNLIVAHHPVTLNGIKTFNGNNATERIIISAIQNNIAIYAGHTNFDSVLSGVSGMMANKIGLVNQRILAPKKDELLKLVTFIPEKHLDVVRNAIFEAGAGEIGNYDQCSYTVQGRGSFRAGKDAQPFVGNIEEVHFEEEIRFETILPAYLKNRVVDALVNSHPYEEVAYDLYQLENQWENRGIGIVGELLEPMDEQLFLESLKDIFNCESIKYTTLFGKPIKKVALVGGSGSSYLKDAIKQKADIFISADFKYHQFFDAEKRIVIADIGHYESEQFVKELFFDLLTKKISKFAVRLSQEKSNPINYL